MTKAFEEAMIKFKHQVEISEKYLEADPNLESAALIIKNLLEYLNSHYKLPKRENPYLGFLKIVDQDDFFIAAEVWYRNACVSLEKEVHERIPKLFPGYEVFTI